MDTISYLIILRALFIYILIEKGWTVKKCKDRKHGKNLNLFEMSFVKKI
jgi:hypothetical protein